MHTRESSNSTFKAIQDFGFDFILTVRSNENTCTCRFVAMPEAFCFRQINFVGLGYSISPYR